jgi:hypothetical protein
MIFRVCKTRKSQKLFGSDADQNINDYRAGFKRGENDENSYTKGGNRRLSSCRNGTAGIGMVSRSIKTFEAE